MSVVLVKLRERPELKSRAAVWFHEKWGVPLEAYTESMDACLAGEGPVPQWYLAMEDGAIVGGLGVIDNDFHDRKDLSPNVCAVYVEESHRCRGIARALLELVCRDMADMGFGTLYLLTDHSSFYERCGWEYFCPALGDGESEPARMYIHRMDQEQTMEQITIRNAVPEDAPALLAVYAPYVTDTAITFEYDVPSEAEFRARIAATLEKYPYFVAEKGGRAVGYAYAGPFRTRAAYGWSAELSIYLAPEAKGLGLGRRLYEALEEALRKMGILNMYACISWPEEEDAYLDRHSVAFHAHMGFRMVGEFRRCGYKFGRWYSMVWMEKLIGGHDGPPTEVKRYSDV